MMHKSLAFTFLLLLVIAPTLGASEPVLISSFELSDEDWSVSHSGIQLPTATNGVTMFDDNLLVTSVSQSSVSNSVNRNVQVYSLTGTLVYQFTSVNTCGSFDPSSAGVTEPVYIDGNIMFAGTNQCPGLFLVSRGMTVIDYSEAFFPTIRYNSYPNTNTVQPSHYPIPIFSSGEVIEFQSASNYWKLNSTDSMINEGTTVYVPQVTTDDNVLHDPDNNVFWSDGTDSFRSYPGDSYTDFIDQTDLGGVTVGVGSPVDWNRNPLNPEWITSEGNLLIVGGSNYDNIQTSGFQLDADQYFMFERSNVVGIKNGSWLWADLTDIGNITVEEGTTKLNADYITREGNNRIVTYNTTTRIINIYEVPLPDFFDFLLAGVNTVPDQDVEFLGVDISDNFIFKNTVSDAEGGRVYQAQTLLLSSEDINDLVIEELIDFSVATDEDFVDDDDLLNGRDVVFGTPNHITPDGIFEDYLEYGHTYDGTLTVTFSRGVTASETALVGSAVRYTYHDSFTPFTNIITHTVSFVDQDDRYLLRLFIERDESTEVISISTLDIGGSVDEVLLTNYNLSGDGDYYTLLPNFDFNTGNVTINFATNESIALSEVQVPFTDPTAFGVAKVLFGEVATDTSFETFYIDAVGITYELAEASTPDYALLDVYSAGETQIFATALEGNSGFGEYTLYSYATDEDEGTNNYDNLLTLNFIYDNSTESVDQQTINQILADAQSLIVADDTDGGFQNSPDFVEGDIVTDKLFGYFDKWNIKSLASKFFVGLIIILLFIGAGGWIGVQVKSPMVSGIGAGFGGLGALFLVTYWGLFPAWVSFTITLTVFVIMATMGKNALTGQGGS